MTPRRMAPCRETDSCVRKAERWESVPTMPKIQGGLAAAQRSAIPGGAGGLHLSRKSVKSRHPCSSARLICTAPLLGSSARLICTAPLLGSSARLIRAAHLHEPAAPRHPPARFTPQQEANSFFTAASTDFFPRGGPGYRRPNQSGTSTFLRPCGPAEVPLLPSFPPSQLFPCLSASRSPHWSYKSDPRGLAKRESFCFPGWVPGPARFAPRSFSSPIRVSTGKGWIPNRRTTSVHSVLTVVGLRPASCRHTPDGASRHTPQCSTRRDGAQDREFKSLDLHDLASREKHSFSVDGLPVVVVPVSRRFRMRQHPRNRLLSHRLFPQDHIQFHHRRVILDPEVHLRRLLRPHRLR
jgi:hypothetical protein